MPCEKHRNILLFRSQKYSVGKICVSTRPAPGCRGYNGRDLYDDKINAEKAMCGYHPRPDPARREELSATTGFHVGLGRAFGGLAAA